MSPRVVPLMVGISGFIVTLMLCGRHEVQPAPRRIPAVLEPVRVEPAAMPPESSGPAAAPPSTLNEDRAMAPDDSATPAADEREEAERRRDDVRGARAR